MKFLIPGPLHPIEVKLISQKALDKKYKANLKAGESLQGFYDSSENRIYIVKELQAQEQMQIFGHEMIHFMDSTSQRLNTEGRCDLLGSYLVNLLNISDLTSFLKNKTIKKGAKS